MDQLKEIHDPDYPEALVQVKEEPSSLTYEEKLPKIKAIIHREFSNELEARENEVKLIDQRLASARRLLHRLRYSLVSSYYSDQKLQLSSAQIHDEIALQRDPKAKAETSSLLRDGQRNIHPSVRRLLGVQSVDIDEIFRTRGPRNKTRKDYSAMLQKRNYTIPSDSGTSLRPTPTSPPPAPPRRVPRALKPKVTNVVTLDTSRNQAKHRYRFIIGNTSKYVPAASRLDRSTHKWLLYVRGPPTSPDPSPLLSGVSVTLHHSYAPHHKVHLDKHPFHISRRGWGEFPAKVELHFTLPERNRPATLEHNIKLDRKYTGMQTLGSETIVDVWLYSTQEMLQHEYTDEDTPPPVPPAIKAEPVDAPAIKAEPVDAPAIKAEPVDAEPTSREEICDHTDTWLDFFRTPTELDVDEMFVKPNKAQDLEATIKQEIEHMDTTIDFEQKIDSEGLRSIDFHDIDPTENILKVPNEIMNQPPSIKKRIVKYIDPTTGKIYYLEMDRQLDLTKVQEIIINNTAAKISPIKSNGLKNVRKKKGVSLLKPEVKNQVSLLKPEVKVDNDRLKQSFPHLDHDHCYLGSSDVEEIKTEESLYDSLVAVMCRLTDVRSAVNHLVKRIPLISDAARDPDFAAHFPFVVDSAQKYWKLDFAKRRNIEWSRAKLINTLLGQHLRGPIWRTKQILLYARLHGHHPVREAAHAHAWDDRGSAMKEAYPEARDVTSLSVFEFDLDRLNNTIELSDDEDIDVTSDCPAPTVKREAAGAAELQALPVRDEDRLRYLYVESKCADVGIELRNQDVGNGYSYSAVHAVLLSAMRSFCEELIRNALAEKRSQGCPGDAPSVWSGWSPSPSVELQHVWLGASRGRLRNISAKDLAATPKHYHAI